MFVAARKSTPSLSYFTPSISESSMLIRRRVVSSWARRRDVPRASSSSKKRTQGAFARAVSQSPWSRCSLSPNHLFTTSSMPTLMNAAFASPAVARAIIVLPHPGGPKRSIPPPAFLPYAA